MTTMACTVVVVLAMATASAALSCEAMPERSCQIRYGPESQDTPTLDKWFAELQRFVVDLRTISLISLTVTDIDTHHDERSSLK
jgi:hypothetical protein